LGLDPAVIDQFSDEFIEGMSGYARSDESGHVRWNESRSRRLGDVGDNAPEHWTWGRFPEVGPHILLLLYAQKDGIKAWRTQVEGKNFAAAFKDVHELPTQDIEGKEPFGFADGISQPEIDWYKTQTTERHRRNAYSNLLAVGEMVLGYPNEYGQYTVRPLLDPKTDSLALDLPDAEDQPQLKDLARNGSYLVLRQLEQDVSGFWRFVYQAAGDDPAEGLALAEALVGRRLDGTPLMPMSEQAIPGISDDKRNRFLYDADPGGNVCPVGAHVRRANPRTGDLPSGATGCFSRFLRILGFGNARPDADLIASTRYHRLLRRGRSYGPLLTPEDAVKPDAPKAPRGLQFVCLMANISRQFEFVQNAWMANSKFTGLQREQDPLLGNRHKLSDGSTTDRFRRPDPRGPTRTYTGMHQFIKVRGGAYFFMPGLKAIQYLASLPNHGDSKS
ncbi:MAG: Dyp-type peroxidase, partial [Gammaproteobacteria bacterium]